MQPCRLLLDPPSAGAINMAADDVLLQSAERDPAWTLRVYRWLEPTLSLGYFQRLDARFDHSFSRDLPVVRRRSGGGAIVHDRELTYSLTLPRSGPFSGGHADGLYGSVHRAWIEALADHGFAAGFHGEDTPDLVPPFLCFQRRTRWDVLVRDAKVLGSAQRKGKIAILQHGSLLLGRSSHAPELSGLAELGGDSLDVDQFVRDWMGNLEKELGIAILPGNWTDAEWEDRTRIAESVFGSPTWTARR